MPTLVLRNVPESLYQQIKDAAVRHRRSMTQEAIVSLEVGLAGQEVQSKRPSIEETLAWLKRDVWTLPVLDRRTEDEILGYNAHGHFD
jgi:plasmid stability protein